MERSVLGVTGAYHFKKHVLSTAAESWDEVLFITGEGKAISEHYEVKDQLWGIERKIHNCKRVQYVPCARRYLLALHLGDVLYRV